MKRLIFILPILFLGCTIINIFGESPLEAAQSYWNRVINWDEQKMLDGACDVQKNNIEFMINYMEIIKEADPETYESIMAGIRAFDSTDFNYKMESINREEATIIVTINGKSPLPPIFSKTSNQTIVKMVKENGNWKWCGQEEME